MTPLVSLICCLLLPPYWALWYEHAPPTATAPLVHIRRYGDFSTAEACARRLAGVGAVLARYVEMVPGQWRFARREPGWWEVHNYGGKFPDRVHRLRCVETPWGTVPLRPPEDPYAPP